MCMCVYVCVGELVDWLLVRRFVCLFVGWLLACLLGWFVDLFVCMFVGWLVG